MSRLVLLRTPCEVFTTPGLFGFSSPNDSSRYRLGRTDVPFVWGFGTTGLTVLGSLLTTGRFFVSTSSRGRDTERWVPIDVLLVAGTPVSGGPRRSPRTGRRDYHGHSSVQESRDQERETVYSWVSSEGRRVVSWYVRGSVSPGPPLEVILTVKFRQGPRAPLETREEVLFRTRALRTTSSREPRKRSLV